ncbi:MAG: hypothetical protein OIF50_11375 [Flavobacteriaceae bacterium]|nr:hypothetical protein [Flavobacteriaceae bacterium]
MFKRISNSFEPEIIGVKNGLYQVELENKDIENRSNSLLTQGNIDELLNRRDEVFNLDINMQGNLLPKAKATDLMVYTPHFFCFNYLVSQKVVDCLKEENVSLEEYHVLKVNIKEVDEAYYLLYVPWIDFSEIVFSESLVYSTFDANSSDKKYFEINNHDEYMELQDKEPFNSFDKVVLNHKYQKRNLISIRGITELFFSDSLVERMLAKNVSSFEVKQRTLLSFTEKV